MEIFVTSYNPDIYSVACLGSILAKATFPFLLSVVCTKGSAAKNKNICIDYASKEAFIIMDDDLLIETPDWNSMLMETLMSDPSIYIVGARLNHLNHRSLSAPDSSIIENIRIPGCLMAVRKSALRFDEAYQKSQCDDIDFMLQHLNQGYKVVMDTRVTVSHPRPDHSGAFDFKSHNYQLAKQKWGDLYDHWGKYPDQYKVLKTYGTKDSSSDSS